MSINFIITPPCTDMVIMQHDRERQPREQSKSERVDVYTEQRTAKPESSSNPTKLIKNKNKKRVTVTGSYQTKARLEALQFMMLQLEGQRLQTESESKNWVF
ncbi:hypothetical protein ACB094_05G062100 [Castanea mollissima]